MQRRGPNTSLYVRPIDATMRWGKRVSLQGLTLLFRPDEVKELFSQYGHVRDVHIPMDFNTRQPRGFAYLE